MNLTPDEMSKFSNPKLDNLALIFGLVGSLLDQTVQHLPVIIQIMTVVALGSTALVNFKKFFKKEV